MVDRHYLTAQEAAEALSVRKATLYAYAARGQLRASADPNHPRQSRYLREDIERLRERKAVRRDPAAAAARGLHWGSAVLDSGITLIQNGALYYRGRDAVELARTATLEQTAEWLWGGEPVDWREARAPTRVAKDPVTALQVALPAAGAADPRCHDLRPSAVRHTGARILSLMTAVVAGRGGAPVHTLLQRAWAVRPAAGADALRAALVLCADHELNISSFTARCAASAGATPYDMIGAALATLKGSRHGGSTERVAALLDEVGTPARARAVLMRRMRCGELIPGFGHPLYPGGDPRARALLELAGCSGNDGVLRLAAGLRRAASNLLNEQPNLDFGLTVVARAFRMPPEAPLLLFALGRTVGWIAHAMEQYAAAELIRPRARYTGPLPNP